MTTTVSFASGTVPRNWYVVDASDKVLGRLASEIAFCLRGKHKPEYTPHSDNGDFIIVINANKVRLTTQSKAKHKAYHWHTGYIGGIKSISFDEMLKVSPERVIRLAVKGMLPKNSLGRQMIKKMRVYRDGTHPHHAQQPKQLNREEAE